MGFLIQNPTNGHKVFFQRELMEIVLWFDLYQLMIGFFDKPLKSFQY